MFAALIQLVHINSVIVSFLPVCHLEMPFQEIVEGDRDSLLFGWCKKGFLRGDAQFESRMQSRYRGFEKEGISWRAI